MPSQCRAVPYRLVAGFSHLSHSTQSVLLGGVSIKSSVPCQSGQFPCSTLSMFISHHHSVHHISGNHPSAHHSTDPSKPDSSSFVSKSFVAPRSVSSKFVPQPGSIRTGAGKHSNVQPQLSQQHTTTTALSFAPTRPLQPVTGTVPAATTQARFGTYQSSLPISLPVNRAPNVTGNSACSIGAIGKNPPAVKFFFKKPQLPAAISSSSAQYHFSTSQNGNSSNSTTGNSLSKFSIPKVNATGGPNGDLSSLSTTGKSFVSSSASSLLEQSSGRDSYLIAGRHVNGGVSLVTPYQPEQSHYPQFALSKHQLHYVRLCASHYVLAK